MTDHHPDLPDRIRHKESGVELACKVIETSNRSIDVRLAPSTRYVNVFYASEWERVPSPFVFPTRPGAQIKADSDGMVMRLTLDEEGIWRSIYGGIFETNYLLKHYGDRLVVTYPGDEPETGGSSNG